MLCNTKALYIFRPIGVPGRYKLVGECYIHRFMHGELFDHPWYLLEKTGRLILCKEKYEHERTVN